MCRTLASPGTFTPQSETSSRAAVVAISSAVPSPSTSAAASEGIGFCVSPGPIAMLRIFDASVGPVVHWIPALLMRPQIELPTMDAA